MVEFALNRGAVAGYRFVIFIRDSSRIVLKIGEAEYQDLLSEVKRLDGEEKPRSLDEAYKIDL